MTQPTQWLQAVPTLFTRDMAKALDFYEKRLGFGLNFNFDDYASVSREGIHLHFVLTDDQHLIDNSSCYIYVKNIQALYDEYNAQGVIHPNGTLQPRDYGVMEFSIIDIDGNLLKFGEVMT